ncbi:cyclophilin peptidyl-prolyl cis-trans isomerase Cyp8 [Lecanora helva]
MSGRNEPNEPTRDLLPAILATLRLQLATRSLGSVDMAGSFIGLPVLVTLKEPPNAKIQGLVTDVVAGQLSLSNVTWLSNGSQTQSMSQPGSNVSDVEIARNMVLPTKEPNQAFIDPAIIVYGRSEGANGALQQGAISENHQDQASENTGPQSISPTPRASITSFTTYNPPSVNPPKDDFEMNMRRIEALAKQSASGLLTGSLNDLSLNGHKEQDSSVHGQEPIAASPVQSPDPEAASILPTRKPRGKRAGRRIKIGPKGEMVSTPTQTPTDPKYLITTLSEQQRRSNEGWRQTPLLEEPTAANIRLPRDHNRPIRSNPTLKPVSRHSKASPDPSKRKSRRYQEAEEQNGWATGEATDIQDMGDFDFEENHKKFDKRKVFAEIRKDDTTADESRLVSFNRSSHRAGTAGGKNLHYTENVLDSSIHKSVEHSSGDTELDISESRSISRASNRRKTPSRKGSAMVKTSFDRTASPKLKSESSTSQRKTPNDQPKPMLTLSQSGRSCACITPSQMLELEQLAITELDLTEDMITENAARGVAQTAYGLTNDDDPKQNTPALIVILAGNNKTGSRAIATGRQLRNHLTKVVLCVLGLEREDELIDSVKRQLKIFRNCGGQPIKQDALMRTLRKIQSPVDLIIDALLGIHISFDDLRSDDQAAYFQLVCWANGNDADILALDVPSGVDASTGLSTTHDSTPVVMNVQHVISLGAPKTGLLTSLALMEPSVRPVLAVADIGIGPTAWKRFGTRRRRGIGFRGAWVAGLDFHEGINA